MKIVKLAEKKAERKTESDPRAAREAAEIAEMANAGRLAFLARVSLDHKGRICMSMAGQTHGKDVELAGFAAGISQELLRMAWSDMAWKSDDE